jgi:hypothetical protein
MMNESKLISGFTVVVVIICNVKSLNEIKIHGVMRENSLFQYSTQVEKFWQKCISRESNPGLPHGKRKFYH